MSDNRIYTLQVKVNKEEKDKIKAAAEADMATISAWMRRAVIRVIGGVK